jgi:hypothetical protein
LQPGDTVGLASPSWGGAGMFPHRVERGVQHLRSLGFRVRLGPHALNQLTGFAYRLLSHNHSLDPFTIATSHYKVGKGGEGR